jgi:hypothetical protein
MYVYKQDKLFSVAFPLIKKSDTLNYLDEV